MRFEAGTGISAYTMKGRRCSENDMKHINTLCGPTAELLIVKVSGTYSYHCALKGKNRVLRKILQPNRE
jgi:hypothetical protein